MYTYVHMYLVCSFFKEEASNQPPIRHVSTLTEIIVEGRS